MDKMQPIMTETYRGTKIWRRLGIMHRTDGPAIEWDDGRKSWYLYGKSLSLDGWLDQNPDMTDEGKVMCKLEYG
jgi:hypothetical protein